MSSDMREKKTGVFDRTLKRVLRYSNPPEGPYIATSTSVIPVSETSKNLHRP